MPPAEGLVSGAWPGGIRGQLRRPRPAQMDQKIDCWHEFEVAVGSWRLGDLTAENLPGSAIGALRAGLRHALAQDARWDGGFGLVRGRARPGACSRSAIVGSRPKRRR
jgi:hypothetical protein